MHGVPHDQVSNMCAELHHMKDAALKLSAGMKGVTFLIAVATALLAPIMSIVQAAG